jgi:hypothetical protein
MSQRQRSPAIRPGFVLSAEADLEEVRQLLTGTIRPNRVRSTHAFKCTRSDTTRLDRSKRPLMI